MSENIKLPTVNDYHHNNIKAGMLRTVIFDLERTQDPAVTPEKRSKWLANARKCLEEAEAQVNKLQGFEPPNRILDDIEEIEARQEIWNKYAWDVLKAEIEWEVYGYKQPTESEERVARGEEPTDDVGYGQ